MALDNLIEGSVQYPSVERELCFIADKIYEGMDYVCSAAADHFDEVVIGGAVLALVVYGGSKLYKNIKSKER
jgi:hypothetical protein